MKKISVGIIAAIFLLNINNTTAGSAQQDQTAHTCACHCPDGWLYFQGSCYLFSHENKTFTDSEHYCLQHQSHLVKVDNMDEDRFLKAYSSDLKDATRWIGLTDAELEGFWKWTDGTRADYIDWYPGQPNNQKISNCAALYLSFHYNWVDEPCLSLYRPICEKAEPEALVDGGGVVG